MNKNPFFFKSYFFVAFLAVTVTSFLYIQNIIFKLEERSLITSRIFAKYTSGMFEDDPAFGEKIIFEEIIKNITFPIVITDTNGFPLSWRNIGYLDTVYDINNKPQYISNLKRIITKLDAEKKPVEIKYDNRIFAYIHMGEDPLYKSLQFAPFFEIIVSSIFLLIGIYAFLLYKKTQDNIIWAGMAKETAHQMGTPLSSLKTWIYMLKDNKNIDENIKNGIEEDCIRLETVANRFQKIGSNPVFELSNINDILKEIITYFKMRIPDEGKYKITFEENLDNDIILPVDRELFKWSLENLIKNSIDSLKNVSGGKIRVETKNEKERFLIRIKDNGHGIDRKNLDKIFNIGFTTKKFGWGIGLPLTKKIIEEFHNGKLILESTALNTGTSFLIIFDKYEKKNTLD